MLKNLDVKTHTKNISGMEISPNCPNRVKPTMLNGVKTEALLVFARTALERYFLYVEEQKYTPTIGSKEDSDYVYQTLFKLKNDLQNFVVNADYLINLVQGAKINSDLRKIAKFEEPLINYYDAMARTVSEHFSKKPAFIPEFLVISVLSHWILEEEKCIRLYPFLKDIDFTLLISKFEINRAEFNKDGECIIADIFKVSDNIIEKLKNTKYKLNKERVSKSRKKR